MENYIFDVVLGVIAVVIIGISAKKGFVISLLSSLSVALSGFLSHKFTNPVSEFIYSSFLYDKIELKLTEVLTSLSQDVSYNDRIQAMLDSIPSVFVDASQGLGFDLKLAVDSMQTDMFSNEAIVKAFMDNIASFVVKSLLDVAVFVVLFVVLSVIFRKVSMLFNKVVKKIPVVGKANTVLGGVLGLVKAIVLVLVICLVVCPFVYAIDIPILEDAVSHSYVYRFVIENNFLNNFI